MADYPISNVTRRVVYAADGVGPYAFTFEILAQTDIAVYRDDTLLTLTTDYTVVINANGTGTITLTAVPTGATQIAIVGARAIERTSDFTTGGDFFANTVNQELDSVTIFAQQNAEAVARALQAPQTDPTTIDMTLPRASVRADKYLSFDVDGNPVAAEGRTEVAGVFAIRDEVVAVAAIDTDVVTVAGIDANVTTVAGIAANVTTVAGISASVTAVAADATDIGTVATNLTGADTIGTVAAIDADITAVAAIDTDVTAVAGDAVDIGVVAGQITPTNNISTVAGVAADVATVAGIAADVTTVAADGTDIGAVAGISANVTTVAGISANVTTVAGISADVTAVAADATDIGTVATNIANVNAVGAISANVTTVAGISADVTAVAGDATDIGTVATNIANVNTVAGVSANVTTVAGISADVTTVATNVADITNFADVYQGGKAADPTLRNDGSALQTGDLYFNTADDVMKIYDGASWTTAFVPSDGFLVAANNLSDLTNSATARTNLGLGNVDNTSDATKNSATVTLTNKTLTTPVINGFTGDTSVINIGSGQIYKDASGFVGIGTSSPAYKLDVAGAISTNNNLTFTGTGNRITGDFSNGTVANRVMFQTSTVNSNTSLGVVPNGTATGVNSLLFNNSDPTNAGFANVSVNPSAVSFTSGITGTGTYLPMTFYTGGSERMRVDTSGNVGIGTSSPTVKLDVSEGAIRTTIASKTAAFDAAGGSIYTELNDGTKTWRVGAGIQVAGMYTIRNHTDSLPAVNIDASGNFLVGTTSTPNGTSAYGSAFVATGNGRRSLFMATDTTDARALQEFYNPNGNVGSIFTSASSTGYSTSSDYRLKENVAPMKGALEKVAALNPVTYNWKVDGSVGQGFIAHELQAVVPDAVTGEKDAVDKDGKPQYQGVDTSFLVGILTAAIQELKAELDTVKAELNVLKGN